VSDDVLRTQADGARHVLLVRASGRIGNVFVPLWALMAGLGYGRYAAQGGDCAPPSPPRIGRERERPSRNRPSTLWPARRNTWTRDPRLLTKPSRVSVSWKADVAV